MNYLNRDIFLSQTEQDRIRKLLDEKKVSSVYDPNALNLTIWQAHTYTLNLMAHAPIPTMRYAPSCQYYKAGETIDAT